MNTVKLICLDDTYRPRQIPREKWVKAGEWYTLTFIAFCKPQHVSGCSLYEKPLDEDCKPFEYFRLSRFGIREDDIAALEELIKACNELDELNINELFEANPSEMPLVI